MVAGSPPFSEKLMHLVTFARWLPGTTSSWKTMRLDLAGSRTGLCFKTRGRREAQCYGCDATPMLGKG